jgi:endonuclease/exonuclease/phosphatase family metal-dependent hydrolase
MKVATWNAGWASPAGAKGQTIRSILTDLRADVIVLTEADLELVPDGGEVVDAYGDWGYPAKRTSARKVLMWSSRGWSGVDHVGGGELPPGRWVAATTDSDVGPVRIVGVCIPWSNAMVGKQAGTERWSEHRAYLQGAAGLLARQPRPLIVAGDFNQRIPRARQPRDVADCLAEALDGMLVPTQGDHDVGRLIDHIAHSPDLDLIDDSLVTLPNVVHGRVLTDHTGVVLDLRSAEA